MGYGQGKSRQVYKPENLGIPLDFKPYHIFENHRNILPPKQPIIHLQVDLHATVAWVGKHKSRILCL